MPNFATLKPVDSAQPNFNTLKPVDSTPKPVQPKSIIDHIFNFADTVTNLVGARSVADTFGSELARIGKTPEQRKFIEDTAPTPLQTAGSALQTGLLFAPFGTAAKAIGAGARALGAGAKLSKFAGVLGTSAGAGYGFDVGSNLQEGKTGAEALKPSVATGIGTAIPFVPPVVKGAVRLGAESLGVTTGAQYGAVKELFNAAVKGGSAHQAAIDAMRGNATPEQIVQEARSALGQIKASRSEAYQSSLARLKDIKESYDITPIIDSVASNLEKFGLRVGQKGEIDFSRSPIRFNTQAQADITKIVDTMKDFGSQKGDRTVIGLDSLKRAFSDLYTPSSEARAFVQSVKTSVRDVLSKVEGYDQMSSNYEDKTHLITDIQKSLSLGDKASIDTAFRKLTTVLRTNNEERRALVSELDAISGGRLAPLIAGQQMDEILPRGIARQIEGFGALGTILAGFGTHIIAALPFASPRIVGEMINALGIGARATNYILKAIGVKDAKFIGDTFLESRTGQAATDYAKNVQVGLSMKNVGRKYSDELSDAIHKELNAHDMMPGAKVNNPFGAEVAKLTPDEKFLLSEVSDKVKAGKTLTQKEVLQADAALQKQGTDVLKPVNMGEAPFEPVTKAKINNPLGATINGKAAPLRDKPTGQYAGSKAAIPKELEPLAAAKAKATELGITDTSVGAGFTPFKAVFRSFKDPKGIEQTLRAVTDSLAGFSLKKNFGETLEQFFARNPAQKVRYDQYKAVQDYLNKVTGKK